MKGQPGMRQESSQPAFGGGSANLYTQLMQPQMAMIHPYPMYGNAYYQPQLQYPSVMNSSMAQTQQPQMHSPFASMYPQSMMMGGNMMGVNNIYTNPNMYGAGYRMW